MTRPASESLGTSAEADARPAHGIFLALALGFVAYACSINHAYPVSSQLELFSPAASGGAQRCRARRR